MNDIVDQEGEVLYKKGSEIIKGRSFQNNSGKFTSFKGKKKLMEYNPA